MNIWAFSARWVGGGVAVLPRRHAARNLALGSLVLGSLVCASLMLSPCLAFARPLSVNATQPGPAVIIRGEHAQYVVRFDGPVNHFKSRMEITQEGRVIQTLKLLGDSAVDVLFSSGIAPPPGRYMLHWTAVSAEGDTSSGDVPFEVAR